MKEQIKVRKPTENLGTSPAKKSGPINGLVSILHLSANGDYYDLPQIDDAKYRKDGSPVRPMRHGRKHQCGAG